LDEFQHARAGLLRGQIALASNAGPEAPGLLLKAARRFETLDVTLAQETYLDAWGRRYGCLAARSRCERAASGLHFLRRYDDRRRLVRHSSAEGVPSPTRGGWIWFLMESMRRTIGLNE
jgi:hypothetical protein